MRGLQQTIVFGAFVRRAAWLRVLSSCFDSFRWRTLIGGRDSRTAAPEDPTKMPSIHVRQSFFYIISLLLLAPLASLGLSVQAVRSNGELSLSNDAISARWTTRDHALTWQSLTNQYTKETLQLSESPFTLVPREGAVLRSSDFKLV